MCALRKQQRPPLLSGRANHTHGMESDAIVRVLKLSISDKASSLAVYIKHQQGYERVIARKYACPVEVSPIRAGACRRARLAGLVQTPLLGQRKGVDEYGAIGYPCTRRYSATHCFVGHKWNQVEHHHTTGKRN